MRSHFCHLLPCICSIPGHYPCCLVSLPHFAIFFPLPPWLLPCKPSSLFRRHLHCRLLGRPVTPTSTPSPNPSSTPWAEQSSQNANLIMSSGSKPPGGEGKPSRVLRAPPSAPPPQLRLNASFSLFRGSFVEILPPHVILGGGPLGGA